MALQPVIAQAPVADVTVNMRGVEIADVAEQISRITGRTLILDPGVKGQVTVTSAEPLSVNGVWELFQSVLRVHGFAAVKSGRAWRVIPQANAVRDSGTAGARGAQDFVTRLIRLQNVPAEQAARVFRPLVANFGNIESLASPNAIVVTDYADNVRRIESLARSLDGGSGSNVESISLRYASARDVATAIQGVLGDGAAGGPRVSADERSNTVLVRGEPTMVAQARRIAGNLDRPGGATPITRMFRLKNGDAEGITAVLRGVLGEESGTSNPVASSLRSGGNRGRLGSRSGMTSGIGGNSGSTSGLAGAVAAATGGTSNIGGGGVTDLTGGGSQANAAPQGFSTPDLTVQPAPELNAIVVRGTPAAIAGIEPLITDLDVRRPQVQIEAAIVEITGDDAEALGIQLGLGAAALTAGDGAATSFGQLGLPLNSILASLGVPAAAAILPEGVSGALRITDRFSVLVQALSQSTKANLLSTPSLTTLDNEAAEIIVGQNVPFRTGSYTSDGNITNPFTTIERQDVGITLRVVPRVHDGDVVRLEVQQEVSSLTNAVTGAADLITNRRSIQTTVLADDRQTIVLGGLISDDRQLVRSQVPVLGDIPVLGELFKARQESHQKRTLFIFLRPTILRDQAAAGAVTKTQYDRLRADEAGLRRRGSILLNPPGPRLTVELPGIY
ncbi:type II secretion system secretin GspD [Sphingomonas naphthae]|uniref:Type II secretion system secretin GspD n=1 Tax=Sphingomonas naphthae TaxID=1813468 RepID=A0ABY7TJJ7_9SPHN|nr:type II secretion system secretin GspD [Sphingomonas naphthae]WCT72882.1 type II secretion system secretin GspD [Sphingomonas naphthae]